MATVGYMMEVQVGEIRQATQNRRENAGLMDFLAAIIIGIFGIFLSKSGIETNSPVSFILGFIIQFSAAGYIVLKFLNELMDFIKSFKKKDK